MTVKVVFFASLRDAVGLSELQVHAADTPMLLSHLKEVLDEQAWESLQATNVRIAVNQEIIEGNTQLSPGDEVAFLPPVTGG